MSNNKSANSGVDSLTGFEFQRNCALYLLLNDYENYKNENYFLCIEHHDDFLFCFRSNCLSSINRIHSYQAKKLSGKIWSIDERFSEILFKMLQTGKSLREDEIIKSDNYSHRLTFISNTESELKHKICRSNTTSKTTVSTVKINEQNSLCHYNELPDNIKEKIRSNINQYCQGSGLKPHEEELDNIYIQWIDFPRTAKSQKDHLIGLMARKFPHVVDPTAAIDLILNLFRNIETVYNQKKIIQLLDTSKRLESDEIKKTIDIIEHEQKIYAFWRENSVELIKQFKIPIKIHRDIEIHIKNAFELLKDLSNIEHQIIRDYVKNNDYSSSYFCYDELFDAYIKDIQNHTTINLDRNDFLFACLCSFVEFYG